MHEPNELIFGTHFERLLRAKLLGAQKVKYALALLFGFWLCGLLVEALRALSGLNRMELFRRRSKGKGPDPRTRIGPTWSLGPRMNRGAELA